MFEALGAQRDHTQCLLSVHEMPETLADRRDHTQCLHQCMRKGLRTLSQAARPTLASALVAPRLLVLLARLWAIVFVQVAMQASP